MNKWTAVFLFGLCFLQCRGREPFKPRPGSLPFLTYFASRYRGLCVGTLVSRTAVITAAVCVTNPIAANKDTRAINVVVGATYRHPRRGIRVQVTKILIPNLTNLTSNRGYLMEKSAAILLLKRKIPDILTEIPLRPLDIDWRGEEVLSLQEECLITGWHFFAKGTVWYTIKGVYKYSKLNIEHLNENQQVKLNQDKIFPVHKFLLRRNIRAQFLNIVKKNLWCEALSIKFRKALTNMGFHGLIDQGACICVRDPDRTAQPCHGMYGAPLICRGRAVAMMMAPDAQWTNCTGFSNVLHLFSSRYLRTFMTCVSSLFEGESRLDWNSFKKSVYDDYTEDTFDYMPELYDKLHSGSESSSDEL